MISDSNLILVITSHNFSSSFNESTTEYRFSVPINSVLPLISALNIRRNRGRKVQDQLNHLVFRTDFQSALILRRRAPAAIASASATVEFAPPRFNWCRG